MKFWKCKSQDPRKETLPSVEVKRAQQQVREARVREAQKWADEQSKRPEAEVQAQGLRRQVEVNHFPELILGALRGRK